MDERSTETFGEHSQKILPPPLRALGVLLSELSILSFNTFMDAAETSEKDEATVIDALERMGCLTDFQAERIRRNSAAELRFDEYVLLDKLGEGGMGAVFKAKNTRLDRIEAIKTIRAAEGHSEALARRFEREAKVLAKLEHPAIVPIYKVGRFQTTDYLAMKYVTGETLKSRVERARQACEHISFPIACQWMIDAADALGHAHEQNIIHRDIKPSNIMRQEKGRVIVLDMGIARLADPEGVPSGPSLTQHQRGLGTPEYMPPEQWADARSVVPASDFYALGCTFFFVLTGRTPFTGNRLLDLMKAHSQQAPPSLLDFRKDVPEALDAVLQKLLAKKPEDRFSNATELIDSIRGFAASSIIGTATALTETVGDLSSATPISLMPTPTPTANIPKPKIAVEEEPPKSRSLAPAILALMLVLFGGIAFIYFKTSSNVPVLTEPEQNTKQAQTLPVKQTPPAVDFAAESRRLLEEAVARNAALLPSKNELEKSLAASGISLAAASQADLDRIRQGIDRLVIEKQKLASVPKVPEWITQFQTANAKDWPTVDSVVAEVRRLTGESGTLTEASEAQARSAIEAKTLQLRRRRMDDSFDAWITGYLRKHSAIWPDPLELRENIEQLLPKAKLNNEQQFVTLEKSLNELEAQVSAPLDKSHIHPQSEWSIRVIDQLRQLVGTHAVLESNSADLEATFRDDHDAPVTQIKINEPVWIQVKGHKEFFYVVVPLDPDGMFTTTSGNKMPRNTDISLEPNQKFATPGKKRFVVYGLDAELFDRAILKNPDEKIANSFQSRASLRRVFRILESGTVIPSVPATPQVKSGARIVIELHVVE